MSVAVIYAAYLAVSIGLTVVVASALSRSGQVLLAHLFGGDSGLAGAVNRMLVVGFYLLSLGYVALTVRTSGPITSAGQAIGVLSVKVGEELLVLGALYLLNIVLLTRFRRRQDPSRPGPARVPQAAGAAGLPEGRERAGSRPPGKPAEDPARWVAEPVGDPDGRDVPGPRPAARGLVSPGQAAR